MSELCEKTDKLSRLLISDLILLCSSALSHPLYFLYIAFFSTYILKIFSFLSPLFITTTLLITSHLPFSPALVDADFLAAASCSLREVEMEDNEEESTYVGVQEVYKFVFDTTMIDKGYQGNDDPDENPKERILQTVESFALKSSNPADTPEDSTLVSQEVPVHSDESDSACDSTPHSSTGTRLESRANPIGTAKQEKNSQNLLKIINYFENMNVEEKKVIHRSVERQPEARRKEKILDAIVKISGGRLDNAGEFTSRTKANLIRQGSGECPPKIGADRKVQSRENPFRDDTWQPRGLERTGSTSKDKEWNRTLACRLFEERHNSEGTEEGMDSLWEAYEMDPNKAYVKKRTGKEAYCEHRDHNQEEEEEEEDDDEDEIVGQLCCLQAFKFSAGKMNLGVGRRNMARISGAVKGFRWLHKQSRRVSSGNAFRFG